MEEIVPLPRRAPACQDEVYQTKAKTTGASQRQNKTAHSIDSSLQQPEDYRTNPTNNLKPALSRRPPAVAVLLQQEIHQVRRRLAAFQPYQTLEHPRVEAQVL